ncbi:MAG TPA: hypothetical protein VN777_16430 [Terriglobales bacterium]|nr:hypothetical protein [Terriglobales bacterium]
MNSLARTSGAKWLAHLCVALLMVATVGQAAHFCGFQSLDVHGGAQVRTESSNTTLCLTCLMAQSAVAMVLCVTLFSAFRRRLRVSPLQIQPRSFLVSFQLYVRPPPTF